MQSFNTFQIYVRPISTCRARCALVLHAPWIMDDRYSPSLVSHPALADCRGSSEALIELGREFDLTALVSEIALCNVAMASKLQLKL